MNESQQSIIFQVKFRQCKHYGNFTIRKIITSAFWKVLLFQPQGLQSYQLLFFMKFVVAIEVERRCKLADSSLLFRAFLSLAFRFSTFTFFLSVHADYHNCKICNPDSLLPPNYSLSFLEKLTEEICQEELLVVPQY